MKKCVLVASGEFSETQIVNSDLVIAVDGGYTHLRKIGKFPDLVIGDLDSVTDFELFEIKQNAIEVIRLPQEKDQTDLLAALNYALENQYDHLVIYGGFGGRVEHLIANIQLLKYLATNPINNQIAVELINGNDCYKIITNQRIELDANLKGYFSVFALTEQVRVTLINVKYPLDNYLMINSNPIGIDNEFIGISATIIIDQGSILLCYKI